MRYLSAFLVTMSVMLAAPLGDDCFTVGNITKTAAVAAGGKKQVLVLLLKRDDLPKGDFQRAIAFCREKKLTMALGGPDPELLLTFLSRELEATGKLKAKGALIVVVGPKNEDARLRPLMETYGVKFIYAECVADGNKG